MASGPRHIDLGQAYGIAKVCGIKQAIYFFLAGTIATIVTFEDSI